ncbi:MAG: ankyrin repeat domain-containing protein [Treponema sp.]|jgi:hypothetical protein|nr:ankyrin repeat domain-containing protein [Treponema sp.]
MKFLLLHEEGEKKKAVRLMEQLKARNIAADLFSAGNGWDGFDSILDGPLAGISHVLLIISPARIPLWVIFIAGYAAALGLPLLLYGGAGENLGPVLSKCLVPVKDEAAAFQYIEKELRVPAAPEDRDQAKYELLENGIPFTEESFSNCVIGGNGKAVSLFIKAGFSSNLRDRFGVPLLSLAARVGNGNIVKILLKAGAQVDQQAGDRLTTALIDAVSGKFHAIVKDLLAAGADVNLKSRDGQSALILAVGLNDEISAEMLLKAGANADATDALGASSRKYAALFNRPAMVALFNIYAPQKDAR